MKKFGYAAKGFIRAITRIVIEIIHRVILHLPDTLFGFLKWPSKKLRIKILILNSSEDKLTSTEDIGKAIEFAKQIFKKEFNIQLLPTRGNNSFIEIVQSNVPSEVLYTKGGTGALKEEFKTAGNFFAANLVAPVYPVTVFIVKDIEGATGCSLGPMTDYITLSHDGAKDESVLAHELAHACGLWHVNDRTNLLWNRNDRGDKIRWWQKNVFRSSRHITYW